MNIISVISRIFNHPLNKKRRFLAIFLFFSWQIKSRLFPTKVYFFNFCEKTKMLLKRGLTSSTGNYYCGLHEEIEMLFLLHYLREDDVFLDVGANIGAYSLLAASERGSQTFAFEPIPSTYELLQLNISKNNLSNKITAYNKGVGSKYDKLLFTSELGAKNRIIVNSDSSKKLIEVDVVDIDTFLPEVWPSVIKIDVEGFEYKVLEGSRKKLENKNLQVLILENNESGQYYGATTGEVISLMKSYNFSIYRYEPFNRDLSSFDEQTQNQLSPNLLFIRNIQFVEDRINEMKTSLINGILV